jgi:hypothetical protein
VQPHQTFIMKKWRRGRENHWDLWLTPETEKAKAAEEAPGLEALLKDSLVMAEARRGMRNILSALSIMFLVEYLISGMFWPSDYHMVASAGVWALLAIAWRPEKPGCRK